MMSTKNLDASDNLRRDEVQKAIKNVHMKIGTMIDVGELAHVTVANVVMNLLWGTTTEEDKRIKIGAEFQSVASKVMDLLGKQNKSDFFPILARFDIQGIAKEMKNCVAYLNRIFDNIIREHKMAIFVRDGRKDFLRVLLELTERDALVTLTQIKAILMDIVVGVTDTTSTIVEWVITEILRNPNIMKKVRRELTDVVGIENHVEESNQSKLQYLDAVAKETFRLHPPLPLLTPRISSLSSIVRGYTIPKDSCVFLNIWSIHMDPYVWDNPSKFEPRRFLNMNYGQLRNYLGNNFEYLPFGSGRRMCARLHLAQKMVMYAVASLLHSFDWKLPDH